MTEPKTSFNGIPVKVELDAIIALVNTKKYLDFDLITYHRVFNIHEVSYIADNLSESEDYLIHRLLMKCSEIKKSDSLCPRILNILNSSPHYLFEKQEDSNIF